MINKIIRFFLENKLIAVLLLGLLIAWGLVTSPFRWDTPLPSDPVAVDAIPDIGDNQQIVFTDWPGRSPQDIDDQITYPLTTALLGIPGVRTIRSTSMFGFSSIYVIFKDDVEFYWSRARIIEKLNSLPSGLLPEDASPALGPDATALGQVFWYTLEGRDEHGNPAGGWDLHELRTVQDFYVKYSLASVEGVSEVASIGGYVREYQVDVDPLKLISYDLGIEDVVRAVRESNLDVGARTIEMNSVEYLIRGLGFIESVGDLEQAVITVRGNTPIRVMDVASVGLGPAQRRGALDKTGADAVGGVVVARYGANPMEVIEQVKKRITEISAGLPSRTLEDGTQSNVTIVPFYDRSTLIQETLGTLEEALTLQVLITIIVIIVMVMHLRTSLLISAMLPVAVLMVFIGMKYFGVDANIVALSGIAIAIGTMVDMAIILTENILRHLEESDPEESRLEVIYRASAEVSSAILTAVGTTIISFLPVFFMEAAEGKLFSPLAYTKTFALIAAIIVTLLFIPPIAHWLFSSRTKKSGSVVRTGFLGSIQASIQQYRIWVAQPMVGYVVNGLILIGIAWLLSSLWMPLGPQRSTFVNLIFVAIILLVVLIFFQIFIRFYPKMLAWCLENKWKFLSIPGFILLLGMLNWQGFDRVLGWTARPFDMLGVNIRTTSVYSGLYHSFPGLGKEFMPSLDEGSFLLMPTTMPHAGMEEIVDQVSKMDMRVASIPEVEQVVGKIGRAESALDPAPTNMFENLIIYKSEYKLDEQGRRIRFRVDEQDDFIYDESGNLIPDKGGQYFRQWRDEIRTPDDIWQEIIAAASIPGVTSAPKLQPIETRLVMLQTGMRAPMGVKVSGPTLQSIQDFGIQVEQILKEVPGVKSEAVFADRIVGKPYLEIEWNRESLARFGITIMMAQQTIEAAIGGNPVTTTVEGRERYPVRVRYARELRDHPDAINGIFIMSPSGAQIPLSQLATLRYVPGPMEIRSEDTFLIGYVLFDKTPQVAELTAVTNAAEALDRAIRNGDLVVPQGVSYTFTGTFENQIRAERRLGFLIPVVLISIFLMLYLQFRSTGTTAMILTGIAVAWAGGFIMLGLYAQPWFMDFSMFGANIREMFQMGTVNLSIAVWVGFIALFGIAVDDGVVIATYLDQSIARKQVSTDGITRIKEIREAVVTAGMRRIRPCLMTSATTILALLPVLTSTGRGSDVMIPMAIPAFGGMTIQLITLFIVPVLYAMREERRLRINGDLSGSPALVSQSGIIQDAENSHNQEA
jgi:copper/silver efflux system protein